MADLLREYVIRLGWETKGADAVRAQVDAQNKAFFKQSEFLEFDLEEAEPAEPC